MSNNLIPTTSPLFASKVVPVKPEEMEPFYKRDYAIRKHLEQIERLKQFKAEYEAKQQATIRELEATVSDSLRVIGMMRQKIRAAKSRIAACIDKQKNAAHNFHIHNQQRAIEQRKIEINRRELGKTAKAMATQLLKNMRTTIPKRQSTKLSPPNIPE